MVAARWQREKTHDAETKRRRQTGAAQLAGRSGDHDGRRYRLRGAGPRAGYTCRRGGCLRQYHSVAAHAVFVSEEIEAFDGLGDGDRRLALHALVADTPSAWLRGAAPGSERAMERTGRLASGIEAAVREAAGLDAVPDEEGAELLRFVTRMAAAAETRYERVELVG